MLSLAWRNLTRRPVRTALTILGVAVAVAFTVGLLSITEGLMASFRTSIEQHGEDILVLPGARGRFGVLGLTGMGEPSLPPVLASELVSVEGIQGVYPVFVKAVPMPGGSVPLTMPLFGVSPSYLKDLRPYLKTTQGRSLLEGDGRAVFLSSLVAQDLELGVGDSLRVRETDFTIVGLFQPGGGLEGMSAYAPLEAVQEAFGQEKNLSYIAVKVSDPARADETAQGIALAFPDLNPMTRNEVLKGTMDILGLVRGVHFSLTSIALLIGALFVLSTMIMAVSERKREIGTMRALGAHRTFIFRLILGESLLTGLSAGVAGCLGEVGLSRGIGFILTQVIDVAYIHPQVSPRLLLIGLSIALVVGALAGLYPAWRTSRAEIVEALRYE